MIALEFLEHQTGKCLALYFSLQLHISMDRIGAVTGEHLINFQSIKNMREYKIKLNSHVTLHLPAANVCIVNQIFINLLALFM